MVGVAVRLIFLEKVCERSMHKLGIGAVLYRHRPDDVLQSARAVCDIDARSAEDTRTQTSIVGPLDVGMLRLPEVLRMPGNQLFPSGGEFRGSCDQNPGFVRSFSSGSGERARQVALRPYGRQSTEPRALGRFAHRGPLRSDCLEFLRQFRGSEYVCHAFEVVGHNCKTSLGDSSRKGNLRTLNL